MKITWPIRGLVMSAVLALLAAPAPAQEKISGNRWKLKYEAGSAPFDRDQQVDAVVDKEYVQLFGGNDREQMIRVADVTQIIYDTTRGRYVSRALANTITESQTSSDLMISSFVCLPMAIAALPFKGTRHFVTIEWAEGKQHRAIVLRMKGKTVKALIAELEQATELTARNLDRERKEFKQAQKEKNPPTKQEEPGKTAAPQEE